MRSVLIVANVIMYDKQGIVYILSSIGTDFRKKINLIPSNKALIYYTRCCVFVFMITKETKISQSIEEYDVPSKLSKLKIFGITIYKSKTIIFESNIDIK